MGHVHFESDLKCTWPKFEVMDFRNCYLKFMWHILKYWFEMYVTQFWGNDSSELLPQIHVTWSQIKLNSSGLNIAKCMKSIVFPRWYIDWFTFPRGYIAWFTFPRDSLIHFCRRFFFLDSLFQEVILLDSLFKEVTLLVSLFKEVMLLDSCF